MRWIRGEKASIALEATLILPFFLVFFMALSCLIRIGVAEVALSSAVSETTKQIAAHTYPAELLYRQYESTRFGQAWNRKLEQLKQLRGTVMRTEQWAEDYSAFIPGPLLEIMDAEQKSRLALEQEAGDQWNEWMDDVFRPIVLHYADEVDGKPLLNPDHLKINRVVFPNFNNKDQAYFEIEAQYKIDLPLPFIRKVVYLTKNSCERAWIGQ